MKSRPSHSNKIDLVPLSQNLRKLAFEDKVALGAHVGTVIACFLPWVSTTTLYGPTNFINAFTGVSWLIGSLVFILSLLATTSFINELFEKKLPHINIPRTTIIGVASIQSLLLQLCAWSVLRSTGNADIEFRFGLVACVLLQIVALVAAWLRARSSKKEAVNKFFQLPTQGKSGESTTNHNTI